jgi:asparagine synthase (glutamine-hydrolysing)
LLEAAHYLIIKDAKIIRHKKYWDINIRHKKSDITLIQAKEKFYHLFEQSIKRRLRADVVIGSSLSGGLDSSSIVAVINKLKGSDQKQETFSARFEGFERDEGKYIDMVVRAFNVQSNQVFLTPELLNKQLDKVFYFQEEPFGSTSIIAQWEVMKLAKENKVTVLLDGQGADEYLAGYKPYFRNFFSSLRLKDKKLFEEQVKNYNNFYHTEFDTGNYFWIHAKFPALRNKVRNVKNVFSKPPYLKQFNHDFFHEFNSFNPPYEYAADLDEALYISTAKRGLNNLLRYADRNSMANGREVRLPFLNYELVEFVFSLPDTFKLNNGWTKLVLREAMDSILPAEICRRKEKVGFEPPKYKYIDKESAEMSIDILTKNKIIDPKNKLESVSWDYFQVSKLY